jgi:hypothetical protein
LQGTSCIISMTHNPKFGPVAQTPEQRAWILEQMQRSIPSLKREVTAHAQQLYARYVAGELSWPEVYQARELAASSS